MAGPSKLHTTTLQYQQVLHTFAFKSMLLMPGYPIPAECVSASRGGVSMSIDSRLRWWQNTLFLLVQILFIDLKIWRLIIIVSRVNYYARAKKKKWFFFFFLIYVSLTRWSCWRWLILVDVGNCFVYFESTSQSVFPLFIYSVYISSTTFIQLFCFIKFTLFVYWFIYVSMIYLFIYL
jgi:hypothetical protein